MVDIVPDTADIVGTVGTAGIVVDIADIVVAGIDSEGKRAFLVSVEAEELVLLAELLP